MTNKSKKTLGIIGICVGWIVPLAGVILAIIGLSLKKDIPEKGEPEDTTGQTLNIIALVESVAFWIIWALLFSRTI